MQFNVVLNMEEEGEEIDISSKNLNTIPIDFINKCACSKKLNFSYNRIDTLPQEIFKGLDQLTQIRLNNNKLCTIPAGAFKDCEALKRLYLENNEINEIPQGTFDGLNKLTEIWLNDNKLCTIPAGAFNSCKALIILDLSNNEIKEIPQGTFDGLDRLNEIWLNKNKLCNISASLFKDCRALELLVLSNNEINEIHQRTFNGLKQLTKIFLNNNKLCTIPAGTFNSCEALVILDLSFNQIKEIPQGAFYGLNKLTDIWLNKNKLWTIPAGAFKDCRALNCLYIDNNEINKLSQGTFDGLDKLTEIWLNNNKLCIIPSSSFKDCRALKFCYLSNNTINEIFEETFKGLNQLTGISLNYNKLRNISAGTLKDCVALELLDLSNNEINVISERTFNGLNQLTKIFLNNNKLCTISASLFKDCRALKFSCLSNNEINEIPEWTFDGLDKLTEIWLNDNKLCTIPVGTFKDCVALELLDLSNNQINEIHQRTFDGLGKLTQIRLYNNKLCTIPDNLFTNCYNVINLNLHNNLISSISFAALEPLKNCRSLDFSNNFLFNPRILYSSFFKKYSANNIRETDLYYLDTVKLSYHDKSQYFILRNDDKCFIEKHFLLFYLSNASRVYTSIFGDNENKVSLKYKFEMFTKNSDKFSLLDLFIWILGDIDDSKIIHLKYHIDQLTRTDPRLINKEFLIRSEHSIKHLCTRNVFFYFKSFFPHTYFELTALLQKTNVQAKDFKANEEDYLKGILRYMLDADNLVEKEENDYRPIFFDIDYRECFNIAIESKNCDIAKFVIILLRYFFLKRPESPDMKDALNKFNHNLLLKFDVIFKYELYEIVSFLLDIRKLDKLKENQKETTDDQQFLVYDTAQFNAKQPAESKFLIKDTLKKKEFLQLIQTSDDLLRHESSDLILQEKWREKRFFTYYFQLFWSLIFVVFYTIYIEIQDQPVDTYIQLAFKYISLIFVIVNILVEILQIVQSRSSRHKFTEYMSRATNWLEWITFVLCVPAIVLGPGDWKSSLSSLTVCLSYVILMTRMDKTTLGGYVKVIGKIARDSVKPMVVVVILLLGFLMAFRNRAQYKGSEESSSFETMGLFNSSFEYSFAFVYTMMIGNLQTDDMGITNLTLSNLVNFFLFIAFLFIISTLAFNIFTGIAIDEIKSLIVDSNVQIMKDKITSIYESSMFDRIPFEVLKHVFRVEDLVTNVKEFWLEIVCGKSNQVEDAEVVGSEERKWQEAYEDDRYFESFETLEDRAKKIENKIDRILSLKEERKGNQVADSVSILSSNDNSLSDGGLKDLFKMMAKISKQQESIEEQMKSQKESIARKIKSQKESIAKQIKESIDEHNRGMMELCNQMKAQHESIDQQMRAQKESIDEQNRSMNELAKQMAIIKNKLQ